MLKILFFFIAVARFLSLDRAENLDMSFYVQKKTDAALVNCSNKLIFGICLMNNEIEKFPLSSFDYRKMEVVCQPRNMS